MNPCKNKTHKKYKKKFKSEDISPTTDWSRYDKKKLQPRAIRNHLSDQENYRKQEKNE